MINFSFPTLEPLEQRIAPAGLVAVTFLNGVLTLDGADGADHDVTIVKTGTSTFRVDGIATDINDLGQTSQSFRGALTSVVIEGGAGADSFNLTNLGALKSLRFDGNAGVDSLTTANLKTTTGARVDIDLGTEAGSVNFFGSLTTIHGALNIDLGGGGTAGFRSALTTIDGDVTITGGSASDALSITGDTSLFKRKLTFTGGDGADSVNTSGRLLTVLGNVTLDGEGGTDLFVFGTDSTKFGSVAPGVVDLKLGAGTGSVTFLGKATTVLGDLKIDLGTGGGQANLNSAVTTVRDNVQVTGGAGNDTLEFGGRTSIARSLSFAGDVGDDTLRATGSLFSVKGATSMDGGTGASTFDLNVSSLTLAGLTFMGGTENDTVSIVADGTIGGDASLMLGLDGTGPSSTVLKSYAGQVNGLKFGGALTIDMVGATVDTLTIANIQVAKAFVAQTGEGVSTVDVSRLNAKSDFKLQTGSGADVVNIDNVNARDFYVDTQIGADELRIERNATYLGTSQVRGIATILTGIGADQIRIGDASNYANLKVSFMGSMTLDTGDGANMRNDLLASNFFELAPQIVSTGGTLTQTEAV